MARKKVRLRGTESDRFLNALAQLGGADAKIREEALKKRLGGWSQETFEKVAARLVADKRIKTDRRGGSCSYTLIGVPATTPRGVKLFVSYSHKDERYCLSLREHLSPLVRNEQVSIWYDGRIEAGDHWENEIQKQLAECHVCVLLISASFIASEYCYKKEFSAALAREKRDEIDIIPIVVRNCMWDQTPLKDLQHATRKGKAIASAENEDEAFTQAAREVAEVVKKRLAKLA